MSSTDLPALRRRLLEEITSRVPVSAVDVVRISADDFLDPAAIRHHRGRHDPARDQPVDPPVQQAEPGTVLVLDGLFLHRDELAGTWDLPVFLDVPSAVSVARAAARDGGHPDPHHPSQTRYVEGQQLYFATCRPWQRADLVIDATDLDAPTLAGGS